MRSRRLFGAIILVLGCAPSAPPVDAGNDAAMHADDAGTDAGNDAAVIACTNPGEMLCGAADCVDVMRDPAHCGSCTMACTVGQTCALGSCSCAALVLDADRDLSNDLGASNRPRIAWNGTNAFVTWIDQNTSVYGLVLTADGAPVGMPHGVAIGTEINLLDVTWSGTAWAVGYAWGNTPSVTVITFGSDGMPVGATGTTTVPITTNTGVLDIRLGHTSAMGVFLVSSSQWIDLTPIGTPGAVAGASMHLSMAGATPIDVATSATDEIAVLMAPLGASTIGLQTVSASGVVMPSHLIGLPAGARARDPSIAHDGVAWVATWQQSDGTTDGIGLARGTTTFAPITIVSNAGTASQNTSRSPFVVARNGQYTVVWASRADATTNLWGLAGERFAADASATAVPTSLESAQTYVASTTVLDQRISGVATSAGVILAWPDSRSGAAEVYDALFSLPRCAP